MAQDYDTGGVFPSFRGHAPTRGRSSGRRWAGHVDPRPVHAGRPPRLEHVRLVGVVLWIASFVCLLAMDATVRQSEQPTLVLLFYFGFLVVLAMGRSWSLPPWHCSSWATPWPCDPSARASSPWAPGPTRSCWPRSSGRSRSSSPSSACRPCNDCSPPRPCRRAAGPRPGGLGRRLRRGGAREMDPPPAVAKVPPDMGLMALLHRPRFEQAGLLGGGVPAPEGYGRDHHPGGTDHAATPARTTVQTPDALTAITAEKHGKLTLLLGDDQ
jgi:hypothetical protein